MTTFASFRKDLRENIKASLYFFGVLKIAREARKRLSFKRTDKTGTLIYIHIGKCGGASLRHALSDSPVLQTEYNRVSKVHTKKPPICKNADYMIVVRNPIKRAISAFNWRYHLVVEDGIQQHRFPGEYEVLRRYETLNNLGESLYITGSVCERAAADFETIHHLHERISFYLTDLLAAVEPERIRFVLAQESLNNDIEAMLGVRTGYKIHKHGETVAEQKKQLSATAYTNLKRYLSDDYAALQKLLSVCHTCGADADVLLS